MTSSRNVRAWSLLISNLNTFGDKREIAVVNEIWGMKDWVLQKVHLCVTIVCLCLPSGQWLTHFWFPLAWQRVWPCIDAQWGASGIELDCEFLLVSGLCVAWQIDAHDCYFLIIVQSLLLISLETEGSSDPMKPGLVSFYPSKLPSLSTKHPPSLKC